MSKQSHTVGNVAIGLAVVVLGFVVYKRFFSSAVTYTGTPPTTKAANATNPAITVATIQAGTSLATSLVNWISASGTTVAAAPSLTGQLASDVTGDSTLGDLGSNIFSGVGMQDTITQDADSAMADSGNGLLNVFGFST
jgi:hypothetical protein